jgi:hypothetical protein
MFHPVALNEGSIPLGSTNAVNCLFGSHDKKGFDRQLAPPRADMQVDARPLQTRRRVRRTALPSAESPRRASAIKSDRIELRPAARRICVVSTSSAKESVESLRRKLRAVAAVVEDPAATEHEKENAKVLRARLRHKLRQAGSPIGDWTDNVFWLGRWIKEIRKSTSTGLPKDDWGDNARRLGKALRRGYNSWLSD